MIYRDTKANAVFEGIKDGSVDMTGFTYWVELQLSKANSKEIRDLEAESYYNDGHADGYSRGHRDGRGEGYEEGYKMGCLDGRYDSEAGQ